MEKELTSAQRAKRKYEEKNKQLRKEQNAKFCTSIPRPFSSKLNNFLEKHKITKVDLIYAGFTVLQQKYEQTTKT